ncbi:uncharacterized protein L3040_008302 [Drepanopeziza brunnea f. sp. 'multigermtubi']|uniref:uncharacterized protein n=1 Tax=Drepanopeziza brunnea f. sp. 'multigermtubi' TaxID=698441 RepID=UPI0023843530|nr:hypothetical protein L3040_008302 [Drepanopeziza brunnea f. sp. 'multigermtubi']
MQLYSPVILEKLPNNTYLTFISNKPDLLKGNRDIPLRPIRHKYSRHQSTKWKIVHYARRSTRFASSGCRFWIVQISEYKPGHNFPECIGGQPDAVALLGGGTIPKLALTAFKDNIGIVAGGTIVQAGVGCVAGADFYEELALFGSGT